MGGDFRFPLTGGKDFEIEESSVSAYASITPDMMGDGSLLRNTDDFVVWGFDTGALASLPALDAGLGIDWHINVARLTPVERRNDFAFGLGGGDGGGEGLFCGFCTGRTAKSTLVRRFEALTGGEDVGGGRVGVWTGFDLGRDIFARGSLGVCMGCGSWNTLDGIIGTEVFDGSDTDLTTLAGVLGSVTLDEMNGMGSDSDEMVMTWAGCGIAGCGRPFLASVVPAAILTGEWSSPCAGLDALHPVRLCAVFCLFGALSSVSLFSFSVSFLTSYGDFIGAAFPTGPFGVPRRLFSDLWRSCDAVRAALFGATDDGRWNGRTVAEGVGRVNGSLVGVLVFFASIGARSVWVVPMASATSTKMPLSRLSSSPSCSSLLSFQ
jgi:hypothetical protein